MHRLIGLLAIGLTSLAVVGYTSPQQVPYPLSHLNPASFTAVSFINSEVGFAAGEDGIYKTADGGKMWAKVYASTGPILDIQARRVNRPSAGREEYVVAYTKTRLIRSNDGQHFIVQAADSSEAGPRHPGRRQAGWHIANIEGVSLLNNNVTYIVDSGTVWISHGTTGALRRATPIAPVSSVSAFDDATCYAATDSGVVYKTVDGGRRWFKVLRAPIESHTPWQVAIRAEGQHVAVLFYGGDQGMSQSAYILYDSNDGGKIWRAMFEESYFSSDYNGVNPLNSTNIGERLASFTMDSRGDVLVVGVDENHENNLALTTIRFDGKTIVHAYVKPSAAALSPFDPWQVLGISTPDGKNVFVAGGKNGKGVIEMSRDGGLTWRP